MRSLQWLLALAISWCHICNADSVSRLAIIIDDIGYNKNLSERAALLPGSFTLSILPFTPYGLSSAQLAHRNNKELMLHTPMSNLKDLPLGKGGLYSGMNKEALLAMLRSDLDNLPFIKGMNNHMGSRLTQEAIPMTWVMEELKNRGLYFIDSRTSAQTVALETAQAYRVPSLKRDVFLDDEPTIAAITHQLQIAITLAKQHGAAIAIGHPYPATLAVLQNIQPLLAQKNINLVFVSQLMSKAIAPKDIPVVIPIQTTDYCAAPPMALWFTPVISIKLIDLVAATLFDILAVR